MQHAILQLVSDGDKHVKSATRHTHDNDSNVLQYRLHPSECESEYHAAVRAGGTSATSLLVGPSLSDAEPWR